MNLNFQFPSAVKKDCPFMQFSNWLDFNKKSVNHKLVLRFRESVINCLIFEKSQSLIVLQLYGHMFLI